MTFAQIEKTREFLKEAEIVKDEQSMGILFSRLEGYYSKLLDIRLNYNHRVTSYTNEAMNRDKEKIKSFLEKHLAEDDNVTKVCEILDLVDEGVKSLGNKNLMDNFVSKVYYAYSGKIKFDKMTETIATAPAEMMALNFVQADENMVNGIIVKLKDYANSLLVEKATVPKTKEPSIQVNNYNTNTANATAMNTVDISIAIDNARKQIEDAGLADEQQKAVMDKLAEIEEIAKSKESKGKRWAKAKEVLKWVAEQGIQVAGIILPLLAPMIGL